MQVSSFDVVPELKLFTKEDVAELSGRSVRSVEEDAADPASPLKWSHRVGRKHATDAATVRAYLESFRVRR